MNEPIWVSDREAVAINAGALMLFSGLDGGVRDQSLFQVALARPLSKWHYEKPPSDVFDPAAAYAFALCAGHVFHDGNKRITQVVAATFLEVNGWTEDVPAPDTVRIMIGVADASVGERALASWFRKTSRKI